MRTGPPPASPAAPRFSPTRVGLYLFCPRAYAFYYQRRLRWGGWSAGSALGGCLHRVLQAFHRDGGAGRVSVEELLAHFRSQWSTAAFPGPPESAAAELAAGEAILRRYHAAPVEPGRRILATEKSLSRPYPGFILSGKLDRIDSLADGSLEIVDYKSGRLTVSEQEVRASVALKIYQLLLARRRPDVPVRAAILCLRSGASASVLRSPDELDAVERELVALVEAILSDREMAPAPGPVCRECPYPRLCPAGREWLAANESAGAPEREEM